MAERSNNFPAPAEPTVQAPTAPRRSRAREAWDRLSENRLALVGLAVFLVFFLVAVTGLFLTSGSDPLLDPARVRLPEKLRPPLAQPHSDVLTPDEVPAMGVYLFGTDDLGRDVFARMLQGAWVSLTVGFVAVGIAVLIGIIMGGIAGYLGDRTVRADQILAVLIVLAGGVLAATGTGLVGPILLAAGPAWLLLTSP